MTVSYFEEKRFQEKDEINVPMALSVFRDGTVSKFPAPLFIVRPTL